MHACMRKKHTLKSKDFSDPENTLYGRIEFETIQRYKCKNCTTVPLHK